MSDRHGGEGGANYARIRKQVQETTRDANVSREEEGSTRARRDVRAAASCKLYLNVGVADPSRTFYTDLIHTTRNVIDLAEAITLGALARTEFRGAHWRRHRERDDEHWLEHTLLSWNDGTPEPCYDPVVLEGENRAYEPKVRSYRIGAGKGAASAD